MRIKEAEQRIKQSLKDIYEESEAANIAALTIEHLTGWRRHQWLKEKELNDGQVAILQAVTERLKQQEPIQYIMNKTWFYGMELYVDNQVLIPRPETEELVDWIVHDMKTSGPAVFDKNILDADETTLLKILDVGTGSGCISLALKKAMPKAEVWGCDISDEALNVARRNGSELDIRVDFQQVNFLDKAEQKQLPSVDIIVSNPPYIPLQDKKEMNVNVVNYEPHSALFVSDEDPLIFYKAIIEFAKHRLHPAGKIYAEIHEQLGNEIKDLFESEGYQVELKKDMQGKDRMVKIISPGPTL